MIVNTTGVVASEKQYIEKAGTFLMEIEKVSEDGTFSKMGNPYTKIDFKCREIITKDGASALDEDNLYSYSEKYCVDENQLFKVAMLRDALEAPEIFDLNDTVGFFVIGSFGTREYNSKIYGQLKRLMKSKKNGDKKVPSPKVTEQQNSVDAPADEISPDEIPF